MTKYPHSYRGIVIQNDDPDKIGRVKVFVPEVNMTLFDKWNKDKTVDKHVTYPGNNLASSLTPEILLRLKQALPWGQVKQPIFGMGTAGFYNADSDHYEPTNDSNKTVQSNDLNTSLPPTPITSLADRLSGTPYMVSPNNTKTTQVVALSPENTLSHIVAPDTVSTAPAITKTPTPSANPTEDNISQITISITGNPNRRRFVGVTATTDVGGPNEFTASIARTTQLVTQTFSKPILYTADVTPTKVTTPTSVPVNIIQPNGQILATNSSALTLTGTQFEVNIGGNARLRRRVSVQASASLEGSGVADSIQTPTTYAAPRTYIFNADDISHWVVQTVDATQQPNLSSPRLGVLSQVLAPYQTVEAKPTTPILPPGIINTPQYNHGGGAGNMFNMPNSKFLPAYNLLQNNIGSTNMQSKQGGNMGTTIPSTLDPNKIYGLNQQLQPDILPPIIGNTQNNKVKGMISIPGVGSHVSVYFDNGDPLYPIVDGVFYNQEDYAGLHDLASAAAYNNAA